LSDAGPGELRLRCVAHSTINNGPGGVTGAGMGADVTADVGGGIVGGQRLRCVAHSTINNGPGGVTSAGTGADTGITGLAVLPARGNRVEGRVATGITPRKDS
jgi:hypothetical protein